MCCVFSSFAIGAPWPPGLLCCHVSFAAGFHVIPISWIDKLQGLQGSFLPPSLLFAARVSFFLPWPLFTAWDSFYILDSFFADRVHLPPQPICRPSNFAAADKAHLPSLSGLLCCGLFWLFDDTCLINDPCTFSKLILSVSSSALAGAKPRSTQMSILCKTLRIRFQFSAHYKHQIFLHD